MTLKPRPATELDPRTRHAADDRLGVVTDTVVIELAELFETATGHRTTGFSAPDVNGPCTVHAQSPSGDEVSFLATVDDIEATFSMTRDDATMFARLFAAERALADVQAFLHRDREFPSLPTPSADAGLESTDPEFTVTHVETVERSGSYTREQLVAMLGPSLTRITWSSDFSDLDDEQFAALVETAAVDGTADALEDDLHAADDLRDVLELNDTWRVAPVTN